MEKTKEIKKGETGVRPEYGRKEFEKRLVTKLGFQYRSEVFIENDLQRFFSKQLSSHSRCYIWTHSDGTFSQEGNIDLGEPIEESLKKATYEFGHIGEIYAEKVLERQVFDIEKVKEGIMQCEDSLVLFVKLLNNLFSIQCSAPGNLMKKPMRR